MVGTNGDSAVSANQLYARRIAGSDGRYVMHGEQTVTAATYEWLTSYNGVSVTGAASRFASQDLVARKGRREVQVGVVSRPVSTRTGEPQLPSHLQRLKRVLLVGAGHVSLWAKGRLLAGPVDPSSPNAPAQLHNLAMAALG